MNHVSAEDFPIGKVELLYVALHLTPLLGDVEK